MWSGCCSLQVLKKLIKPILFDARFFAWAIFVGWSPLFCELGARVAPQESVLLSNYTDVLSIYVEKAATKNTGHDKYAQPRPHLAKLFFNAGRMF